VSASPPPRRRAWVLTISDRCARGEMEDTAGPAVVERLLTETPLLVEPARILPDERERIEGTLLEAVRRGIELVLTVGGTGCGPRDVTPEATRAVVERLVPGLSELMRRASAEVTTNAYLSRAVAGIAGRTLVANLPGSQRGAVENLAAILPLLPHALELIAGDTDHPASDAGRERA